MNDDPSGLLRRLHVLVQGEDVSPRLLPRLLRMTIRDASGEMADTAEIELDDRDMKLSLPRAGVAIDLRMGDQSGRTLLFGGVVDAVRFKLDRAGGRILTISAKSADVLGTAKQLQERHFDDVTIGEALRRAGEKAGIEEVRIDPDLDSIFRSYLAMENESFLAFGDRLAREVGATFKVSGSRALFVRRNSTLAASGRSLTPVPAAYGENLISCDITPFDSRPRHRRVIGRHYDPDAARLQESAADLADDSTDAELILRYVAADGDDARDQASATAAEIERAGGSGTVTIDGDLRAKPGALCQVRGVRPGIDGDYLIDAVEHSIDRSAGMLSRLDLGLPQGTAGQDARRAG